MRGMKMSNTHEANVVRVGAILPHPNADKLEITMVGGYQVVIGKGSFTEGDLAVYIQPDSVVPQREPFKFIWQDHVGIDGVVPAKRRRITVKRLRKEYSEGLLMPVTDFPTELVCGILQKRASLNMPLEGFDVAPLLGIEHYVPEEDPESTKAETAARPKRKYPRSLKGWFFFTLRKLGLRNAGGRSYAQEVNFDLPEYDVNALKNAKRGAFYPGERVIVTEKIHGSNARYAFIDGKFYVGSHAQWKMDGPNVWWNVARKYPQIEKWCRWNPGKVLYGEVGPTQKGFRYGAKEGDQFFFAFDVYDSTTGKWSDRDLDYTDLPVVPLLYIGQYDLDAIKALVDGTTQVSAALDSGQIREGVVISSIERRLKLKIVSNAYLLKDS
jgi:hypothetical protein